MKILFLTTDTRPEVTKISLRSLRDTVGDKAEIIICNDKEKKGHAYNYNESLSKIGFDDDIVKCDDDLVFYDKDWFDKYLSHMDENTMVGYGRRDEMGNVSEWGCLMMIPKEILRKVGYMYEGFGQYGYSDPEYRMRIRNTGAEIYPVQLSEAMILHDQENIPHYKEFKKSNSPLLIKKRERMIEEMRSKYDDRLNDIFDNKVDSLLTYKKYADIPSV